VLAHMAFPKAHRQQLHSTNPLERLNAEIKRRTEVVGIFPNDPAITRLVGAMLLEQNDEWCLQRRYMQLEAFEAVSDNPHDNPVPSQTPPAAPAASSMASPKAMPTGFAGFFAFLPLALALPFFAAVALDGG